MNNRAIPHTKYNNEFKQEILDKHYKEGYSSNYLAREYNMPRNTIKNWFVLTNKGKNIFEDKRTVNSGRIPEKEASFEIKYNIVKKMEIFLKHQKEIRHSSLIVADKNSH